MVSQARLWLVRLRRKGDYRAKERINEGGGRCEGEGEEARKKKWWVVGITIPLL